ncbi:MAG: FmdE family protein [Bacillota bacterium]
MTHGYPADLDTVIKNHGHLCIGSAIGYRVAKYALRLVDKGPGLIVFTGSEGCPVHAIEILTGCSRESGTIRITNENGWCFYDQSAEEGFRFTLKENLSRHNPGDREKFINILLSLDDNEIFNVAPFDFPTDPSGGAK